MSLAKVSVTAAMSYSISKVTTTSKKY